MSAFDHAPRWMYSPRDASTASRARAGAPESRPSRLILGRPGPARRAGCYNPRRSRPVTGPMLAHGPSARRRGAASGGRARTRPHRQGSQTGDRMKTLTREELSRLSPRPLSRARNATKADVTLVSWDGDDV